MSFWETWFQPRTIDYPFTVIQMQIGRDGHGKGTLSYATRVIANGKFIELELDETDKARAKQRLEEMCRKLLANTMIENYSIEVVG